MCGGQMGGPDVQGAKSSLIKGGLWPRSKSPSVRGELEGVLANGGLGGGLLWQPQR